MENPASGNGEIGKVMTIKIGELGLSTYVDRGERLLTRNKVERIAIQARGRKIVDAVTVALRIMTKSRVLWKGMADELIVESIKTSTMEVKEEGKTKGVSEMEILLVCKDYLIAKEYMNEISQAPNSFYKNFFSILHEKHPHTVLFYLYQIAKSTNKEISELIRVLMKMTEIKASLKDCREMTEELHGLIKTTPQNLRKCCQFFHDLFILFSVLLEINDINKIIKSKVEIDKFLRKWESPEALGEIFDIVKHFNDISQMLSRYGRADQGLDKIGYIVEAQSILKTIQEDEIPDISDPFKPIIREISKKWEKTLLETQKKERGKAILKGKLLTKRIIFDKEVVLVLSLKNEGSASAQDITLNVLTSPSYEISDEWTTIEIETLPSQSSERIELKISPKKEKMFQIHFEVYYGDIESPLKVYSFSEYISFIEKGKEFIEIKNPYIPGRPVRQKEMFFGREDLFDYVQRNISSKFQNNILVLQGQRRCGKTSFLIQLRQNRLDVPFEFVYIDVQRYGPEDEIALLFGITKEITKKMAKRKINCKLPAREDFWKSPYEKFNKFLEKLEFAVKDRGIVLMFDEFEVLEEIVKDSASAIFPYLRSIMIQRSLISFIFVGTFSRHKLETHAYWPLLFNMSIFKRISVLKPEEAKNLIRDPVIDEVEYDEIAIDKILRLTGGNPFFIQMLCFYLINLINKKRRNYVVPKDVDEVFDDVLESEEPHLSYLWVNSDNDEKDVLKAVANLASKNGKPVSIVEISRLLRTHLLTIPLETILDKLVDEEILVEVSGNPREFSFQIKIIEEWVHRYGKFRWK